jgi:hypothetical protein
MISYVADFETTVPKKGEPDPKTRVWAWGLCEVGNVENFHYGNDINTFFSWCRKENKIVYFHNLKFDGAFILYWLLTHGFTYSEEKKDNTFNTIISSVGQFYQIEVIFEKKNKKYKKVTFLDSLKKLPFPVSKIAKDFKLPISKLEIDYALERPEGYQLTPEEVEYLKADVQIVAWALGIQFDQGLTKMTIGADALKGFKDIFGKKQFERCFPVLPLNIDKDIRQSYKGGFTYVSKRYAERDISQGIVFDVNSLYPSVLYNRPVPIGTPLFFRGKYRQDQEYPLYVQQLTCEFKLKKDHIPTIQVKGGRFVETEYLEESGLEPVTMILTSVDIELFFQHYDVDVHEWVNGWKFMSSTGLFKDYIDHWTAIKEANSLEKNALYTLAKLMLNSLYGKFGKNPDVTGKYPVIENGHLRFILKEEELTNPIYVPVASFVTAWARYTTITTAQKVYDRFIYADTDSIHLEGAEVPDNIEIHNSKLGAWKHEGTFTRARFLRAKTYIEEMDGHLHVTCAGLPDNVKKKVTWENFRRGNSYGGKLLPKQISGGVVLQETEFTLK